MENALRVLLALGGSTNALIHLTAIAGRVGVKVDLERLDALSEETPVLVDLKPTGEGYMEDFHAAGGMRALLRELRDLLHLDTTTSRQDAGEQIDAGTGLGRPHLYPRPRHAGLAGRRAGRAVRQPGAARRHPQAQRRDPALFETEARAVVFDGLEDLADRIDDPALDVTANDILVLKNAGPLTPAGMPEAGYLPIP